MEMTVSTLKLAIRNMFNMFMGKKSLITLTDLTELELNFSPEISQQTGVVGRCRMIINPLMVLMQEHQGNIYSLELEAATVWIREWSIRLSRR
jgi:hypothetical protein